LAPNQDVTSNLRSERQFGPIGSLTMLVEAASLLAVVLEDFHDDRSRAV
jgi:hypothetical protein